MHCVHVAVELCTYNVSGIQVAASIDKQSYNFCVIVENSQVEWCAVLLFQRETGIKKLLSMILTFKMFTSVYCLILDFFFILCTKMLTC